MSLDLATPYRPAAPARGLVLPARALQLAALWLWIFSGFLAIVEPSPYEILFLMAGLVYLATGLKLSRVFIPMIVGLLVFNLGGAFSLIPYLSDRDALVFIVISFYMAVTAMFFAGIMLEDTLARLETIRHAWVLGAMVASICGMLGYFDVAGLGAFFTKYGRAAGTFKDPNVMGPFVGVPIVLVVQGFLAGTLRRPFLYLIALIVMLGGVFFSFSRGAWGVTLFSCALTGLIMLITTRSNATRRRIVTVGIAGVILLAVLLAIILSIEPIRALFEQRFSLTQDYDVGVGGRFGKLGKAIQLLLDNPNGLGPLQFDRYFPEAPHNVYVNAFSSYGWLGGLAYVTTMAATMVVGWAAVGKRTPWQGIFIALWSITFFQIVQGMQIDTDHWRHFWFLIGSTWGLAAASFRYEAQMQAMPRPRPHSAG